MKIKKILSVALLTACIANSNIAYADDDIYVLLNGEDMSYSVAPIVVNNRTLVPADELLKYYNIPYAWNNQDFIINVSDAENITLTADKNVMQHNKNGEIFEIPLDSNMVIKDNDILLPLRAVSEALGYTVDWHDDFGCVSIKTKEIVKGEHKLDNYIKFLNKSKDEIKAGMIEFELYTTNISPFIVYSGTDAENNTYVFGFMEGVDRCCVVETSIDKVFTNLNEYYESYERIDKVNIEKYVGSETTQKVDNLYGHYLEYYYKDCSVRILCNADGSTSYEVGMYVTQNEPTFLEFVEKEFPVQ